MTTYTTASEVAAEVYARVQDIKIENGYETEMGRTVFQGKVKVVDEQVQQAIYCVSVLEGIQVVEEQAAQGRLPAVRVEQRYGLVGYAVCDLDQPNLAAHAMLRDFKRAIWKGGDSTWGGKVRSVQYRTTDIGPRPDGVAIVMALLEFGVEYAEQLGQP